jgi:hypothetical protein
LHEIEFKVTSPGLIFPTNKLTLLKSAIAEGLHYRTFYLNFAQMLIESVKKIISGENLYNAA